MAGPLGEAVGVLEEQVVGRGVAKEGGVAVGVERD